MKEGSTGRGARLGLLALGCLVLASANQNVEVDVDGDNVVDPPTYPQCQDPRLYQCLV